MSTADTSSSVGLDRRPQPSADGTEPKAPAVPKPARKRKLPVWVLVVACIVALGAAGGWYWWQQQLNALPPYIAAANGASKPSKPKSPPSIRAASPSCSPKRGTSFTRATSSRAWIRPSSRHKSRRRRLRSKKPNLERRWQRRRSRRASAGVPADQHPHPARMGDRRKARRYRQQAEGSPGGV